MGNKSSSSRKGETGAPQGAGHDPAAPQATPSDTIEVGFIGHSGAGKTSIVMRLTTNPDGVLLNAPTSPANFKVDGPVLRSQSEVDFQLVLVDPGPARYYEPRGSWWLNKQLIVLVYDQSLPSDELQLENYCASFQRWGTHAIHLVLIGNKWDEARADTRAHAVEIANRFGAPHYSISALTNEGLFDAISDAAIECFRMKESGQRNQHAP